jgi:hypothetical protein
MKLKINRWDTSRIPGIHWGEHHECGIWIAAIPRRRYLTPFSGAGDSVFIAIHRLRIRFKVNEELAVKLSDTHKLNQAITNAATPLAQAYVNALKNIWGKR